MEIKNNYLHNLKSQPRCMQSTIIVWGKEELLSCPQAYVKTSHRPARSFQQKNAQEICPVDVVRNTLVQNMVQHSYSNHVDHIRRQTHGPTHTHGIFLRSNWHVHVHARTHAHIHTLSNHECTCMPDRNSKTTVSLSPQFKNAQLRQARLHTHYAQKP